MWDVDRLIANAKNSERPFEKKTAAFALPIALLINLFAFSLP